MRKRVSKNGYDPHDSSARLIIKLILDLSRALHADTKSQYRPSVRKHRPSHSAEGNARNIPNKRRAA
jgi:hypothetical protein